MVSVREIGKGFGCLSAGIIHLFLGAVGLIIHAWTVIIAYSVKGFLAAVITLACPVISEIYWGFHIWNRSGIFFNSYTIALFIYVGLGILMWISMFVYSKLSEDNEVEHFSKYALHQGNTNSNMKKISNKIIAIFGIVTYILSVIASATDLGGNLKFPIALVLISGTLSLIFVIMATIRLWNVERILSILFLSFNIILITLSVFQEVIMPTYGSPLVILTNIVKVIRIILFIWVLIKLFKTNSRNIVVES